MTELGDIHERINDTREDMLTAVGEVKSSVSELSGVFKATLPHLATKADLGLAIDEHEKKTAPAPASMSSKQLGAIAAAVLAAATAVLAALAQ